MSKPARFGSAFAHRPAQPERDMISADQLIGRRVLDELKDAYRIGRAFVARAAAIHM